MTACNSLEEISSAIAEDVVQQGSTAAAVDAFDAYWQCLQPLVTPYVRDGFLERDTALPRFLSETATLQLVVSLVPHWCAIHGVGHATGFWDIHQEAAFFSWYEVPRALLPRIEHWAVTHSTVDEVLHAVMSVAETSVAGLRRRALGEFFTPIKIAQHMVSLTGASELHIAAGKVADPACGNGNLLAAVVANTVRAVECGMVEPDVAISDLNRNIYGFDIQPLAVLLTRLQLLLISLPILRRLKKYDENVFETLSFPYIDLCDPLSNPKQYWDLAPYDIVLGNPPFLKAIRSQLPFVAHYEDILRGQPNLYQLFLWWAMRATRAGGRIVFLVPQPIRAGQYLQKLREQVSQTFSITAVTSFADRTGIFESVEQQLMILALTKSIDPAPVSVRACVNGEQLEQIPALNVSRDELVRTPDGVPIWCVSSKRMDYSILDKVCSNQRVLKNAEEFEVINGGFVWNQHKDKLMAVEENGALPLVSSASVGVHRFIFPPLDQRVRQRLFVEAGPDITEPVHMTQSILLKRTTPNKFLGRRIVATTLSPEFLAQHESYFVENHVNLIRVAQNTELGSYLAGLSAWLNSRLANFVFGMMNGSSHLSKFELELIPAPKHLFAELNEPASALLTCSREEWRIIVDEIDERIYGFFGLTAAESARVAQVVPCAE